MEITDTTWQIKATDYKHKQSLLECASKAGIEVDVTVYFDEDLWLVWHNGEIMSLPNNDNKANITTEQFQAMCDAYAATPVTTR